MDIRIQSLKFNADQKLIDYIEKKLSKLPKYYDEVSKVEVVLSLLPDYDNKNVKVLVDVPGNQIVVERHSIKFENALVECVDVLKDLLVKAKEKRKEP
ncbi:MAG: ribosome-associated translation inhibitor RaiA [Bacteroidales bacterium]|jgi:putative sigma-54 modulation protein|nr:ribosome-associated translation inhibitor RaiA [Bacteroidales bacterium]MDD3273384.1 ribosome-associated translation inhibitor RaiA [Bacteroidales bacterium]MDD4057375.1 ribosome-associated translation inhibitor RaiA [Bacteroidales bacterium]